MERQDGGEAIQRVRQGCESQPVETSERLGQVRSAPDELWTAAAALTIVEVATEVATGTAPPAQPGSAERPVETSELLEQGRPAPDELLTKAAALTIVEVATEVATGAVPPPSLGQLPDAR